MGMEKPLMLGGGVLKVAGNYAGQIENCYVEKQVQKIAHMTNVDLEYRTDRVMAISSSFNIGFTFQEINPQTINLMTGALGYSAVPIDRSLPGPRKNIDFLQYGGTRFNHEEFPRLESDSDGRGRWYGLSYPIVAAVASPRSTPVLEAINVDFAGAVIGYVALVIEVRDAADDSTRSIASNIAIVPYADASDSIKIVISNPGNDYQATDTFSVYRCEITSRLSNGEFDYDAAGFLVVGPTPGTPEWGWVTLGSPDSNGYYVFDEASTGNELDCDTVVDVDVPLVPIQIDAYTGSGAVENKIWPGDFLYYTANDGKGKIKMAGGSTITEKQPLIATYSYTTSNMMEIPLSGAGINPVIPMTLELEIPGGLGTLLWQFWKVQVNSNFRLAANANDWYGMDFTGETLDNSEIYPNYHYGMIQLFGPIVEQIKAQGNLEFPLREALQGMQTKFG